MRDIERFNNQVDTLTMNTLIHLPKSIDYLASLLTVVAFCGEDKNAVTESKAQTAYPIKDLVQVFKKSDRCWPIKNAIVLFFYHIYLDTEKEMKEDIEFLNDLFIGMVEDVAFISTHHKTVYQLYSHKGIMDSKSAQDEYFFEGLIVCLSDILSKRFYGNLPNYSDTLDKCLHHLIQMYNQPISDI